MKITCSWCIIKQKAIKEKKMIEKILEIASSRTELPLTAINADTNLLELDIDSLDIINIIMDVEYCFNVKIEDDEIIEIRTPNDILDLVMKRFQKND